MQPSEYFILVLFIVLGVFSITASVLNLDWYEFGLVLSD